MPGSAVHVCAHFVRLIHLQTSSCRLWILFLLHRILLSYYLHCKVSLIWDQRRSHFWWSDSSFLKDGFGQVLPLLRLVRLGATQALIEALSDRFRRAPRGVRVTAIGEGAQDAGKHWFNYTVMRFVATRSNPLCNRKVEI